MVNLRSPVVKISWPIHLPGRNLSQHSSWSTCYLSWTNRIFSPFWGSLSKWPSDDNHLPWRNHRQHSSWSVCCLSWTNRIFTHFMGSSSKWTLWWQPSSLSISPPTLFSSLAFSNPAGRSHIENQAWGPSTLPNSLLILRWPLTPEDVDQDISSHLQLMSIKMWL